MNAVLGDICSHDNKSLANWVEIFTNGSPQQSGNHNNIHDDNHISNKTVKVDLTKNIMYANIYDNQYDENENENKNKNINDKNDIKEDKDIIRRKRQISNIENDHLKKSKAGFHIQANSIFISFESNTNSNTNSNCNFNFEKKLDKNININMKSDPTILEQESFQFRKCNEKEKQNEIKKIENFSSGAGLCIEMEKIKSKMFFALIPEKKEILEENKKGKNEKNGLMSNKRRDKFKVVEEVKKILYLEYPIFEVLGSADGGKISLKNNIFDNDNSKKKNNNNNNINDNNDNYHDNFKNNDKKSNPIKEVERKTQQEKGLKEVEIDGHNHQLIPPNVPHTDIIHFIAHQIDLGKKKDDTR